MAYPEVRHERSKAVERETVIAAKLGRTSMRREHLCAGIYNCISCCAGKLPNLEKERVKIYLKEVVILFVVEKVSPDNLPRQARYLVTEHGQQCISMFILFASAA